MKRATIASEGTPETIGDLPQFVLCVAVNAEGWPVACEVFHGNTADIAVFDQVIAKLRERFRIGRIIVVANRGMISKRALKLLTEHEDCPLDYVLCCRMRRQKEVGEEVRIDERRYVVCLNPEEALKDATSREAILSKLEEIINQRGAKAVVGNRGYARFLKVRKGGVTIKQEAVGADRRFDGKSICSERLRYSKNMACHPSKSEFWSPSRWFPI